VTGPPVFGRPGHAPTRLAPVTSTQTVDLRRPEDQQADEATRTFSTSILVSAVRCLLAYIVFPWLLPAIGVARGAGPGIGIVVGAVAVAFNVLSIRRFWRADHRWKWPITAMNATVIVLLVVLLVQDLGDLLG
jgi:hypothetical protein